MDANVDEAVEQVRKVFGLCASATDARGVPSLVLMAGSGRGKTHFLEHLRHKIHCGRHGEAVFITFNSRDMDLDSTRLAMKRCAADDDWKFNYEIAIRLLYSYFDSALPLEEMAEQASAVHDACPREGALLRAVVSEIAGHVPEHPEGGKRILLGTDESMKLAEEYGFTTALEIEKAYAQLRRLSGPDAAVRVGLIQTALWPGLRTKTDSGAEICTVRVPNTLLPEDLLSRWLTDIARLVKTADRELVEKVLAVFHNWPRAVEKAHPLLNQFLRKTFENDRVKRDAAMKLCSDVAVRMGEKYAQDLSEAVLFHAVVPFCEGNQAQEELARVDVVQKVDGRDVPVEVDGRSVGQLISASIYIPQKAFAIPKGFVPRMSPVMLVLVQDTFAPVAAVFKELLAYPKQDKQNRGTLLETVCARWLWFIGRCALARGKRLTLGNVFLDVIGGPAIKMLLRGFELKVDEDESIGVQQLPGVIPLDRHLQTLDGIEVDDPWKSKMTPLLKKFRDEEGEGAAADFKRELERTGKATWDHIVGCFKHGHTTIITEGRKVKAMPGHKLRYVQPGWDSAAVGMGVDGRPVVVWFEPHREGTTVPEAAEGIRKKLERVRELVAHAPPEFKDCRFGLLLLTDDTLRNELRVEEDWEEDGDEHETLEQMLSAEFAADAPVALGVADQRTLRAFIGPWAPLYSVAVQDRRV